MMMMTTTMTVAVDENPCYVRVRFKTANPLSPSPLPLGTCGHATIRRFGFGTRTRAAIGGLYRVPERERKNVIIVIIKQKSHLTGDLLT